MSAPVPELKEFVREANGEELFTFWQPGIEIDTLAKSASPSLSKGSVTNRSPGVVKGFCSTQRNDRQGQIALQKGLDFRDFYDFGFFNDNHGQHTADVVGIPSIEPQYKPARGWYTEGELLDIPRAHEIAELSKALKGTRRSLGFSVEGKILEKSGNFIVKARVRMIAITNCPVNPDCTLECFAKSFFAGSGAASRGATDNGAVMRGEHIESESEYPFACGIGGCRSAYRGEGGLTRHQAAVHPGAKSARMRKSLYDEHEAFEYLSRLRPGYAPEIIRNIIRAAAPAR